MTIIRRFTLGIGAACLVGGWGVMRYANGSYEIINETYSTWVADDLPLYIGGIVIMAFGAGLIVWPEVLRLTKRKDE